MKATKFSTRAQMMMTLRGHRNIADLARDLGYERYEKLARLLRYPDAQPSADMLEDFANTFANLNTRWLLTGLGAPLTDGGTKLLTKSEVPDGIPTEASPSDRKKGMPKGMPNSEKDVRSVRSDLIDPAVQYRSAPVVTVSEDGEPNIVMLDSRAAAGLPSNYGNAEFFADKPAFRLPGWKYKGHGMIALQVTGDSMAPTVHHDDWLIARHLTAPLEEMREGYVHILVTKDGCVAKRLFKAPGKRPAFICKSDNEDYPAYEQVVGDHDQVYVVTGILSEDLSNKGGGVRDRLRQLEKDVLALQQAIKGR